MFCFRNPDCRNDCRNCHWGKRRITSLLFLGVLAPWREAVFLQEIPRLTTRPEHIRSLRQTILNLAVRGRLVPQSSNDEPAERFLASLRTERSQLGDRLGIRIQSTLAERDLTVCLFDRLGDPGRSVGGGGGLSRPVEEYHPPGRTHPRTSTTPLAWPRGCVRPILTADCMHSSCPP